MKHEELLDKIFALAIMSIASLIGAYFTRHSVLFVVLTFTSGLTLGVFATYLAELIKNTKI